MPPTFLYLIALGMWLAVALLVWVIAGTLALTKKARPSGLALAAAMVGT